MYTHDTLFKNLTTNYYVLFYFLVLLAVVFKELIYSRDKKNFGRLEFNFSIKKPI